MRNQSEDKYHVYFCYDGRKDKVVFEETFDNEGEYEWYVHTLPYDFIDADDTAHWVDFGDE